MQVSIKIMVLISNFIVITFQSVDLLGKLLILVAGPRHLSFCVFECV